MEVTGKVVHIGELNQITEKFAKRDLVVEVAENPQYPETIKFEMNNERAEVLDNLKVGQDVTVHFNLRGRPWTNKQGETVYFNTLEAWRVQYGSQVNGAVQAEPVAIDEGDGEDDLPF